MGDLYVTRSYHFSAGHRLENPAWSAADNARITDSAPAHGTITDRVTVGSRSRDRMSADLAQVDAAVETAVLKRVTISISRPRSPAGV
jgi:hypothetical protein